MDLGSWTHAGGELPLPLAGRKDDAPHMTPSSMYIGCNVMLTLSYTTGEACSVPTLAD